MLAFSKYCESWVKERLEEVMFTATFIHPRLHVRYIEPRVEARRKLANCLACTELLYNNYLAYSSILSYLVIPWGACMTGGLIQISGTKMCLVNWAKKCKYRVLFPISG